MPGKQKKVVKKGKKKRKPKRPTKIWEKYTVSGEKLGRKSKFCPKCGAGVLLAEHKDRITCGKCGYTIFKEKSK